VGFGWRVLLLPRLPHHGGGVYGVVAVGAFHTIELNVGQHPCLKLLKRCGFVDWERHVIPPSYENATVVGSNVCYLHSMDCSRVAEEEDFVLTSLLKFSFDIACSHMPK
jgi:hypothetical protein